MSGFTKRADDVLLEDDLKVASSTRFSDSTLQKTQEFISLLNKYVNGNTMNKRNAFFFGDTIIDDSNSPPIVMGQRPKSGTSNINVLRVYEKALSCYIPFQPPIGLHLSVFS